MTTSIKSVNTQETQASALGTTAEETEELSESTKMQLEALGITVTEGMTEAQAQEKIEQAKRQKAQQAGTPASETEVTADIKNLASAIGISYEDTTDPQEILTRIAEELEAQIDEAAENPQELNNLMRYYRELTSLDAEYDDIQKGQAKIYSALNMISESNKKAFGLE